MRQIPLGRSGLMVSEFCLGTMTWGNRNTEADGHAQLDLALDRGVNFIDTAEMYPTNPVVAETVGRTEEIIGSWLAARGAAVRDRVVVATKVTGAGNRAVRDGAPITPAILRAAVDASLRRLRTEVIDLYQLHWPNRGSYHFRQHWGYDPSKQDRSVTRAHMAEILGAAQELVAAGKLRHVGLSNETAWGTAQWLALADAGAGPRMQSIQNEYSLLCRHFDTDLAELSVNEDIPLLAYSPLATGLLTGKYAGDVVPEHSRRTRTPDLGGRVTPRVWEAVAAHLGIAKEAGLDPVQMALAWCRTRPFVTIPILGATSTDQLELALGGAELTLGQDVLEAIALAWRMHPLPY
jgi:aryl-alcohol dehydrogenase-like predicted oxidoreductase